MCPRNYYFDFQGDGTSVSQCQSTYTGHKKSVLSVTFLESMRITASCDSVVHIWDPFMGSSISQLEGPKVVPISMVRSMPSPSSIVLAATDTTIRLIDARICSYVHELKVCFYPELYFYEFNYFVIISGLVESVRICPMPNDLWFWKLVSGWSFFRKYRGFGFKNGISYIGLESS